MNEKDTVDHCLKCTWHNMSKMYNQVAAKFGTTQATGLVLLCIDKEGTPSTSIAPSLGMESTSLSRIMKTLEENKLIYRKKDRKDKRMVRIFLTQEGIEKRRVAKSLVSGFQELINQEIPQSKLSMFFEVMEAINEVIDQYKEQNEI